MSCFIVRAEYMKDGQGHELAAILMIHLVLDPPVNNSILSDNRGMRSVDDTKPDVKLASYRLSYR